MDDAELQRELNDALAVSPSPDFVARVRVEIARAEAPALGAGWRLPAAVVLTLVAIAVGVALKPASIEPDRGLALLGSRPIATLAPAPMAGIAPLPSRATKIDRSFTSSAPVIPEVLIAADNRLGLMQLLDGVRERRFEATFDETPSVTPWVMTELTVAPLTIEPIAVEPLDAPAVNN